MLFNLIFSLFEKIEKYRIYKGLLNDVEKVVKRKANPYNIEIKKIELTSESDILVYVKPTQSYFDNHDRFSYELKKDPFLEILNKCLDMKVSVVLSEYSKN